MGATAAKDMQIYSRQLEKTKGGLDKIEIIDRNMSSTEEIRQITTGGGSKSKTDLSGLMQGRLRQKVM